jgi:hypothetical protein
VAEEPTFLPAQEKPVITSQDLDSGAAAAADSLQDVRRSMLVEALIRGVNAHHGLLARTAGHGGDESCLGTAGVATPRLEAFVQHHQALIATPLAEIQAWLKGAESPFNPGFHLSPLFETGPRESATSAVARLTAALRNTGSTAPTPSLRAVAHLHQIALETNRDGNVLQQTYTFLHGLGLPIDLDEIAIPHSASDLTGLAHTLGTGTCAAPYEVTRAAWRITLQKILNWGLKHRGIRDTAVVTREILATPAVQALAPHIASLPAQNIVIIGHSFTMPEHWSSPSSFAALTIEALRTLNPEIHVTRFSQGGLSAADAQSQYYDQALALAPQRIYLAVTTLTAADRAALALMIRGFRGAHIETLLFDAVDIHDPYNHNPAVATAAVRTARDAGATIVPVQSAYEDLTSGLTRRHLSLDGVHMTEPYHRFMTLRFLSHLVGGEAEEVSVENGALALAVDGAGYHTVENGDQHWASLLEQALGGGRTDLKGPLVDLYVRATWDCIKHAVRHNPGTPVQVMIWRENELNAAAKPRLEALLRARGWRLVPAASATVPVTPAAASVPELSETDAIDQLLTNYGLAQ